MEIDTAQPSMTVRDLLVSFVITKVDGVRGDRREKSAERTGLDEQGRVFVTKISMTLGLTALLAGSVGVVMSSPALAGDKVVHVYNWSDYIDTSVLEQFTKETGIKVQYDVYDSNDILETKLLAGKTGYDVVVPTSSFLARQIKAGVHEKLDKSKLPNLVNMWPWVTEHLAKYDPNNEHGVDYMWGTTGVGYNVKKIKAIMPDAPIGSWKMVFDPAVVAKFKDCGVMMLDADDEVIPSMMAYLGLNPDSKDPADFKKAEDALKLVRPFVRKFHSSEYLNAIANGDICIALGWSGDFSIANSRAKDKNKTITDDAQKIEISYFIPKEGADMWFDSWVIPADAPNKEEAYAFINFMMKPDVIAKCTNYVTYANGNLASQKLIDPAILNDPTIYPDAETQKRLFTITPYDKVAQRALTDTWRNIKSGS